MLEIAEVDYPATQAQRIFELETDIAACHWDKVKTRDLRLMYNLMSLAEFSVGSAALHWRTFMAGADIDERHMAELVVEQPSFFTEVADLLTDDRLQTWKVWLKWRVIGSYAPYLSSAFVNENFAFYGTTLQGTPQLRERWKRGVGLVEGALGEAVGKVYVERHFSPVAKQRMDELVANLIKAYHASITELAWMTDETKAEALTKLAKFRPHIGFPSKWRDYSALEIAVDDLIGNVQRASSFELDRSLTKIGQPVDREEWLMTPQTVNAYYHPLKNEIVFPAAILQPPFFNEHADDAVNYGGIGAVIGHEIGHGFDDQGSTCDGDGALRDWWTETDRAAFERANRCVDRPVRRAVAGRGAGLARERQADHRREHRRPRWPVDRAQGVPDRARRRDARADRRLHRRAAAVLVLGRDLAVEVAAGVIKQRLATDPHSPNEFRCNQIVRNVDDFYAAFEVAEGDELWLEPAERVSIW